MEFGELDDAKRVGGKKRKKKARANDDGDGAPEEAEASLSSELRTGRWTPEETTHCDNLIHQFMSGRLPLSEGLKLNEFLAGMLKSKQSRLTKKMKNAKLSSKTFKRTIGFLGDDGEARSFGDGEAAFFASIQSPLERAEMKFHISKEWREAFSTYCVSHGQSLNVDGWLASVEEMDRRNQRMKEAERVRRREMMMGVALRRDGMGSEDRGVTIEGVKCGDVANAPGANGGGCGDSYSAENAAHSSSSFVTAASVHSAVCQEGPAPVSEPSNAASPFLQKIIAFLHRHHVPFEYVDAWVPSFVPDSESADKESDPPKCRLCFAGSMVAKQVIVETPQSRRAVPLSPEESFNLSSFGDYSESFSFDVGCGLPGRVYHMGVPTWEQSVHNAPLAHFERVGGAQQWGFGPWWGFPCPVPTWGGWWWSCIRGTIGPRITIW